MRRRKQKSFSSRLFVCLLSLALLAALLPLTVLADETAEDVIAADENIVIDLSADEGIHHVTLNANGGYFDDPDNFAIIAEAVDGQTLRNYSEPAKDGYAVVGWAKDPEGKNIVLDYNKGDNIGSYVPTEDIILYAVWAEAVNVTFDANGGYTYGLPGEELTSWTTAIPKNNEHYRYIVPYYPEWAKVFLGWATDQEGSNLVIKAGTNGHYQFNEPATLYAVWVDTDISNADVSLSFDSCTYTGTARKPSVKVTVGNYQLVESLHYEVNYRDNINAGTATVTVTGSPYGAGTTGTISKTFTINQKSITPAVTLSKPSFTYNTKVQRPTVTVKDGSKKLSTDDYSVTYSNAGSKNPGTYKVTVQLKGNYSGNKSVTYKIVQAAQPLKVKPVNKTVSYAKLKKANQVVGGTYKFTKKAQGKLTYKKVSGIKKIVVNSKTGKITVKKGLAKGTYPIKIKLTAAGNAKYKKGSKTIKVKITVK